VNLSSIFIKSTDQLVSPPCNPALNPLFEGLVKRAVGGEFIIIRNAHNL